MRCRSFAHSASVVLGGVLVLAMPDLVAQGPDTTMAPAQLVRNEGPASSERFTAPQLQNMHERIALAGEVVDRLEADAKRRGFADGWRRASLESMLSLHLAALRQVHQRVFTAEALPGVIAEVADDPTLLGDASKDLTYTPITPCRYIDTRNVGGAINATTRAYDLVNNGAMYGGSAGCDPFPLFAAGEDQIAAIAMNVTVVSPAIAPGFVAIKPTAASPVTSLVNWYEAGPSVQAANQGVVTMLQDAAVAEDFVIQTSASTHVIVDFFGAFAAPAASRLNTTTLYTEQFVKTDTYEMFSPPCPAGWAVTGGGHLGSDFDQVAPAGSRPVQGPNNALISGVNVGDRWFCQGKAVSPHLGVIMRCFVLCARTPGR